MIEKGVGASVWAIGQVSSMYVQETGASKTRQEQGRRQNRKGANLQTETDTHESSRESRGIDRQVWLWEGMGRGGRQAAGHHRE